MDDGAARERVRELLDWAERELELPPSAFKGCTEDEIGRLCAACEVGTMPAAYDEFLRMVGKSGVGSALYDIFPGDDVAWDSMMPADDWPGGRGLAEEIVAEQGYDVHFGGEQIVIHTRRTNEVEYIAATGANPPVWALGDGGVAPRETFASFTDWLEWRIARAIKRRYPLRDASFPG